MADAVSIADLEHIWNPAAQPLFTVKPPEWIATYLPRYCQSAADRTESDCRDLVRLVRELQRDGFWERLFPDWESCCQALFNRPAEWVEQVVEGVRVLHSQGHTGPIGSADALAVACREVTPAGPPPEPGMLSPNPAGKNQHTAKAERKADDSPPSYRGPNGRAEILRRIKRDHPDIAERVERGEFKSARAAGMAAGFIKPSPPTIRLVRDPPKVAAAIARHFTRAEIEALCEALLSIPTNDQ